MAFLSSLNIGGSGLTAQRMRMDVASQNIANADTTRTAKRTPYRRRMVVFEERGNESFENVLSGEMKTVAGAGVRVKEIIEDQTPFVPVYNPSHPDADENGYVMMPNVDKTKEMLDLMSASNSYQANLNAVAAVKKMALKALEIR
ncbi:MAG TPA: flagellar basal body rod protein FlgC [Ruminococcaceae bacterium]|nr:flagellar basal body rod protein FlgC [Oscillospiraceae bacterium]